MAILCSLGLHALLLAAAWRAGFGARRPAAPKVSVLVEISAPPRAKPPEPRPVPEPDRSKAPAPARSAPAPRARPARLSVEPSPPSSGEASTEPAPSAPVDLTGETLVLASTARAVGGSGNGSGTRGSGGIGARLDGASAAGAGTGDRSGRVALDNQSWACPWPREADSERIDEQTVVIRVVVNADGTVASATLVSDPGHGFGPAAIACALRTRFTPARDREGRPIRAASPPVLVRFTR